MVFFLKKKDFFKYLLLRCVDLPVRLGAYIASFKKSQKLHKPICQGVLPMNLDYAKSKITYLIWSVCE